MRCAVRSIAVFGAAMAALLLPARPGFAWGPEVHRTIALIADHVLQKGDTAARKKLLALLADDKDNTWTKHDLAGEATWADVLRDKSEEARAATAPWHTLRLRVDNPDLASACFGHKSLPPGYPASRGPRDNCVVDKIEQFAKELQDPATGADERTTAVQFLLNLVGDLHDPLLAIDRSDRGGACIALQIGTAKSPVRLVNYWEQTLAGDVVGRDPAKAAERLNAAITPEEAQQWAAGTPAAWGQESYELAKTVVYSFAAEAAAGKYTFPARAGEKDPCGEVSLYRVPQEYETKELMAVRTQLAKGGVRLARVLRESFK